MSNGVLSADSQDEDLLHCAVCSRTQLKDAVLLKCLHSACRSCAGDASALVTCTVCGVTTDTSTPKVNLIFSTIAHRSLFMKNVFSCTQRDSQNQCQGSSVTWCYTCQHSLCTDCERHHRKYNSSHKVKDIDEHTVLSELYRPPLLECSKHGEEKKLVCFTCQDVLCFKCAHDCYNNRHDVHPLDSPAAADLLKEKIACAERVLSDLSSADQLLEAHISLPEEVASAIKESQASLRNAKQTVMDSICKAYERAEQSLFDCWDILVSKAEHRRESADSLKKRLEWTNKYSQLALRTEDVAALLPQLDTLCSRLRSLLDEARQLKQPIDPLKLVSINLCLPPDLDTITSEWIGKVALVSDNFDGPIEDAPSDENGDYVKRGTTLSELEQPLQQQMEQQKILQHQLLEEQQPDFQLNLKEMQQGLLKPLRFNEKSQKTFPGRRFFDVAVTSHGRLLVAALSDGLKEYDTASFDEIATWKPEDDQLGEEKSYVDRVTNALALIVYAKRNDRSSSEVCTVDALADGRAVVGLHSKLIVLLRRDAESIGTGSSARAWRVELCITELQASPRRLSAWNARLLAVLEDRYDEHAKSWRCGPGLVLFSLSDGGKMLNRQKLDYDALSIALTDRVVVVASDCEVAVTDAACVVGGNIMCYVVDCYSHAGVRLWRHSIDDGPKIMSVCSDSLGRVMYAAKWGSVVALSVDDGGELSTAVALRTQETEKPYAIALDRATQRLMALISEVDDEPNIITIFSVV